jgi:hypothetical protein
MLLLLGSMKVVHQIPEQTPVDAEKKQIQKQRTFTVKEIEKIVDECKKSTNPLECIRNQIYFG